MSDRVHENESQHAAETGSGGDFEALLQSVREHPLQYALSAGFIALCALAGIVYQVQLNNVERNAATEFARALDEEDPHARAEALAALVESGSSFDADALYMQAEAHVEAGEYDLSAAAFNRLREEFPEFEHVPDAVEGLGAIAEEQGDYETALARYREVMEKWPGTFAGLRQPYNIGRCEERRGNLENAIAAYREQLEVFPGSNVANRAARVLDDLRRSSPELFKPAEPAPGEALDSEAADSMELLDSVLNEENEE